MSHPTPPPPPPVPRARYSPPSTSSLLTSLRTLRAKQPKAVNSTIHIYPRASPSPTASSSEDPENPERYITSWKMSEHLYRRKDCPFPTLARGLFTAEGDYELPFAAGEAGEGKERGEEKIVARGYDKFFNVGEVEWTTWDNIAKHSLPPYDLTYKSNGCLILISALSPTELMVSSKHSLGTTTVPVEVKAVEAVPPPAVEASGSGEAGGTVESVTETLGGTSLESSQPENATTSSQPTDPNPPSQPSHLSSSSPPPTNPPKPKSSKNAKPSAKQLAKTAAAPERLAFQQQQKLDKEAAAAAAEVVAHAEMGRRWVRKTLERVARGEEELAGVLWEGGWTAVTELCDDEFEQHVLETTDAQTGLHLHGINTNTPHFSTLPISFVQSFAAEWGFITTPSERVETLTEVKELCEVVAKEGVWRGMAIEGFVVRCVVKPDDEAEGGEGAPPYAPGSPFFFKVKFEEPYLMYRQWREITRTLLPLLKNPRMKGRTDWTAYPWTEMGTKLNRPESKVYAEWCAGRMIDEPELFENYETGVIPVRNRFLAWVQGEGAAVWEAARRKSGGEKQEPRLRKTMIVPVAVPGCGKTLLGVALGRLLGVGHTQSDDITTKKTAKAFQKNISDLLRKEDVVYCDRNNHLDQHHKEMSNLAHSESKNDISVRTIALVWDVDSVPYNKALRVSSERVHRRGDNHQSLRPDPQDQLRHESVIKMFLSDFVPPEGGLFDRTVKLRMLDSLEANFRVTVEAVCEELGREVPGEEEIKAALKAAQEYRPEVRKDLQGRESPVTRYYALAMELDLLVFLRNALASGSLTADPATLQSAQRFLDDLDAKGRIVPRPHITIVHEKSVAAEQEATRSEGDAAMDGPQTRLWNTCATFRDLPAPPMFDFDLTSLLWDERVMTLVVDNIRPAATEGLEEDASKASSAKDIEQALVAELKDVLHVTVGTSQEDIPPFEARGLVTRWREGGEAEAQGPLHVIGLDGQRGSGRVLGMS